MQHLYYQFPGTWFGDCMPFGKGDTFYLFHQRDTRRPVPFGEPFGWDLAVTRDFVHYEDRGVAIPRGTDEEQDQFIFAGSVFEAQGLYHSFYTGYNRDYPAQGKPAQVLMHAVSTDLLHWEKTQDKLTFAPQPGYDPDDWRDPFVVWDQEKEEYLLILGARLQGPKTRQTGRTVKFTSKDLKDWKFEGDFWAPDLFTMHEMPDLFQIGDWWYHIVTEYSHRSKMVYRMSKSLSGPWLAPKDDALTAGPITPAAPSPSTASASSSGGCPPRKVTTTTTSSRWGGTFVAHEVYQRPDGTLGVRPPQTCGTPSPRPSRWRTSPSRRETGAGNRSSAGRRGTFSGWSLTRSSRRGFSPSGCASTKTKTPARASSSCSMPDEGRLLFEPSPNWPWPDNQNLGLERPLALEPGKRYAVRMIVDDTIATLYVDGVALNTRVLPEVRGHCQRLRHRRQPAGQRCQVAKGLRG